MLLKNTIITFSMGCFCTKWTRILKNKEPNPGPRLATGKMALYYMTRTFISQADFIFYKSSCNAPQGGGGVLWLFLGRGVPLEWESDMGI